MKKKLDFVWYSPKYNLLFTSFQSPVRGLETSEYVLAVDGETFLDFGYVYFIGEL